MCGRFTYYTPPNILAQRYFPEGLEVYGQFEPSYNITPGVGIPMIRSSLNGTQMLAHSHWGFRPAWAGEKAPAPINARAETVATSNYFREAFGHHRCLIPANGWFEWVPTINGKEPHYMTAIDPEHTPVLFFAGIWTPVESDETTACAIITEPASDSLKHIHDRQPVVLDPACLKDWLDPSLHNSADIRSVTKRLPMELLEEFPVATRVNSPRNNTPDLIHRA